MWYHTPTYDIIGHCQVLIRQEHDWCCAALATVQSNSDKAVIYDIKGRWYDITHLISYMTSYLEYDIKSMISHIWCYDFVYDITYFIPILYKLKACTDSVQNKKKFITQMISDISWLRELQQNLRGESLPVTSVTLQIEPTQTAVRREQVSEARARAEETKIRSSEATARKRAAEWILFFSCHIWYRIWYQIWYQSIWYHSWYVISLSYLWYHNLSYDIMNNTII